jgi:dTDP-glucose 4,6-dehydratase
MRSDPPERLILVDPREVSIDECSMPESEIIHIRSSSLRKLHMPGIDVALILGGHSHVDEALAAPGESFSINTEVAIDVGEWLLQNRRVRMVYLSSDEVLGESFAPLMEDARLAPTQPYAASKAAAEVILHCYRDAFRLDLVTLRSCNLVGPHQRANKLIPNSVRRLTSGLPVEVHGTGRQIREWMDVRDICSAILLAKEPIWSSGAYNCSSQVRLSVLEVVRLVGSALGINPRWVHSEDRKVQDRSYCMCNDKAIGAGWRLDHDPIAAIQASARAMALETHSERLSARA